jgi:5-hydroxyisourate hydrolase
MKLSTHVLDVARGRPAAGIEVALYRLARERTLLASAVTDADGRIASPFGGELEAGWYELVFLTGRYFAGGGLEAFYDEIPVRFRIDPGDDRYHVPLLLSPFGYSTYRGS